MGVDGIGGFDPLKVLTENLLGDIAPSASGHQVVGSQHIDTIQMAPQTAEAAPAPAPAAPKEEKGFFSKIWGGITDAASAVGDAAKAVGGAVVNVGKRIGDAVSGIFTGAVDGAVGVARNLWEGAGTFFGGIGKLFQGKFGEGFADMGKGLVKTFVQTPVDLLLMQGGRAISAVQTLFFLEPVGRKLTDDEISKLKKVYGDSIDYSRVQIKEGNAGLFSLTDRPFTHGNTIYVPPDSLPLSEGTLVHEMSHVWQHQNGGTDYMSEALWAQYLGDGYDWQKGVADGKSWADLNPEQQAQLIEVAYENNFFSDPNARVVVDGTDYTDYIRKAVEELRRGDGAP